MATFTEEFTRMRHECDEAQSRRHQLAEDIRAHVQEMAHSVQQQLAGFRGEMQQMHEGIMEMTERVRGELSDFSKDLSTGGRVFRKESKPR